MAAKPMSIAEIQQIVQLPIEEIAALLEAMKKDYDEHGFKVVEHEVEVDTEAGKQTQKLFELHIKDEYAKKVEHLAPAADFSRGMLQTLSLIAYRAPMKQSEVIQIRGNRAYEHVAALEERSLIKREPKGHTKIITLTRKFLDYFGIGNLSELKTHFTKIEKEARAGAAAKLVAKPPAKVVPPAEKEKERVEEQN